MRRIFSALKNLFSRDPKKEFIKKVELDLQDDEQFKRFSEYSGKFGGDEVNRPLRKFGETFGKIMVEVEEDDKLSDELKWHLNFIMVARVLEHILKNLVHPSRVRLSILEGLLEIQKDDMSREVGDVAVYGGIIKKAESDLQDDEQFKRLSEYLDKFHGDEVNRPHVKFGTTFGKIMVEVVEDDKLSTELKNELNSRAVAMLLKHLLKSLVHSDIVRLFILEGLLEKQKDEITPETEELEFYQQLGWQVDRLSKQKIRGRDGKPLVWWPLDKVTIWEEEQQKTKGEKKKEGVDT